MPLTAEMLGKLKTQLEIIRAGAPSPAQARERLGIEISPDAEEQAALDAQVYLHAPALSHSARRARLATLALKRIEKKPDSYGICQCCNEPIDPKRLNAVPEAEFCVTCQGLVEQGIQLPANDSPDTETRSGRRAH